MFKLITLSVVVALVRGESWVPWNARNSGLPAGAVHGGNELEGSYVIRANTHGALLPGKYSPSQDNAYVSTNGAEHAVQNFEVLTAGQNELIWENAQTSRGWVKGGRSAGGDDLFICRFWNQGKLMSGKYHYANGNQCHVPYVGKEWSSNSFETLKFN